MKLIIEKEINDEVMTRIEYLSHLKHSYEFILNEILKKRSKYKYDKENVDYYMDKYSKISTEFVLLSNEILSEIDKKYMDQRKYYSEYNFEERNVKVYEI